MARPRVLLAITVFDGRPVVPRCLTSARRLAPTTCDLDVVVLDDASPEPGWSAELEGLCATYGMRYYRSPRNLGIPRNVNLGLLLAQAESYDHVIISNSDVVYPANLIDQLVAVAATDPTIGSVTAWSNNVSLYSLPNEDPDAYLADQETVDWVSERLAANYGVEATDVPAGISFCILIPTPVLREVGLMDPVYGRGYCEETDWSLRSAQLGYRVVLAQGTFVYHKGRASTTGAGLLRDHETTVEANEAIIDHRYPTFREEVASFWHEGLLRETLDNARRVLIADGARQLGYDLDVSWLPKQPTGDLRPRVRIEPDGTEPGVWVEHLGFRLELTLDSETLVKELRDLLGGDPEVVQLFDRGQVQRVVGDAFGTARPRYLEGTSYPEQV